MVRGYKIKYFGYGEDEERRKHLLEYGMLPEYVSEEIPKDVPWQEYYLYIRKIHIPSDDKDISLWTAQDYKQNNSLWKREQIATIMKLYWKNDDLSPRELRIIERVRRGIDFDVGFDKRSLLTENAPTYYLDTEQEVEYAYRHPEIKDQIFSEKDSVSVKEIINYFINRKKKCVGRIVGGTYYGEEIPENIPYTEYWKYIYQNFGYDFEKKICIENNQVLNEFDKTERRMNNQRLLAAYVIKHWSVHGLTAWQQRIIEEVRIGKEIEDSNIDSDFSKIVEYGLSLPIK